MNKAEQFFDFIKERERVRLRKEADLIDLENFEEPQGPPWTDDPILQAYKFTNVRRHHDRTSRVLREKFYNENFHNADRRSMLMNCATFRYFGTYEFADVIGWTDFEDMDNDHWEAVKEAAADRLANKERVFTGAYIITNQGISAPKQEVVVDYFLKGLQSAIPEIMKITQTTDSWEEVAKRMRKVSGFGGSGFMTKEVLLDTTYMGFWQNVIDHPKDGKFSLPSDWYSWTPIGPGARRGAARILGDDSAAAISEEKAGLVISQLGYAADSYDLLPIKGVLAPHDIQFQLCEFDKYERVRLGQGKPRSRFRANLRP